MEKTIEVSDSVVFKENYFDIKIDGKNNLQFTFPFTGRVKLIRITGKSPFSKVFNRLEIVHRIEHDELGNKIHPLVINFADTLCYEQPSSIIDYYMGFQFNKGDLFKFIGVDGFNIKKIELYLSGIKL